MDDCHSSYKRKDHLTRHLLAHKGKLFKCPIENCKIEFSIQANMKRHVRERHNEDRPSTSTEHGVKPCVCQEVGCGKAFAYPSQLQKHEESHGKLQYSILFLISRGMEWLCLICTFFEFLRVAYAYSDPFP